MGVEGGWGEGAVLFTVKGPHSQKLERGVNYCGGPMISSFGKLHDIVGGGPACSLGCYTWEVHKERWSLVVEVAGSEQ